ncbi:hypothetical protein ARMGADRAFT_891965, partial [Armillaria gallica]
STCSMDDSLWHRCLCHCSLDIVRSMHSKKLVTGMTKINNDNPPDPICVPCLGGKQHHHDIPRTTSSPPLKEILEVVYSDVKGPMPVATPEGYCYFVTFI